jgi:hypothetical protein
LFNDVLSRFTLLGVTARSDEEWWVGRQMSNVLAKPYRVGEEAGRAIDVKHGRPIINVHYIRRNDMGEWKLGDPIGRIRGIGD